MDPLSPSNVRYVPQPPALANPLTADSGGQDRVDFAPISKRITCHVPIKLAPSKTARQCLSMFVDANVPVGGLIYSTKPFFSIVSPI
jgi:hypothetical protein